MRGGYQGCQSGLYSTEFEILVDLSLTSMAGLNPGNISKSDGLPGLCWPPPPPPPPPRWWLLPPPPPPPPPPPLPELWLN